MKIISSPSTVPLTITTASNYKNSSYFLWKIISQQLLIGIHSFLVHCLENFTLLLFASLVFRLRRRSDCYQSSSPVFVFQRKNTTCTHLSGQPCPIARQISVPFIFSRIIVCNLILLSITDNNNRDQLVSITIVTVPNQDQDNQVKSKDISFARLYLRNRLLDFNK